MLRKQFFFGILLVKMRLLYATVFFLDFCESFYIKQKEFACF